MPTNPEEIARREAAARERIKAIYGTAGDEFDESGEIVRVAMES